MKTPGPPGVPQAPAYEPDPSRFELHVRLTPRRYRVLLAWLAGGCGVMLLGTAVFYFFFWSLPGTWEEAPPIKHVLVQFNLAVENVLAVWYASMLLLLVAVASVLCFIADRNDPVAQRRRALHAGWLGVAGAFTLLSLDEIGSLHERVITSITQEMIGGYTSGWHVLMLVLAGMGLYMLAFGWFHLRRRPASLVMVGLGVACFLSIPVQEHFEIAAMRASEAAWKRPLTSLLLEEGTELLGVLCFLGAAASYLAAAGGVRLVGRWRVVLSAAAAGVVLLGLFGVLVHYTLAPLEGDSGVPRHWFPAALAFGVACLCFQLYDQQRRSARARAYLLGAAFALASSAYVGAASYAFAIGGLQGSARWLWVLATAGTALGTGYALARPAAPWASRAAIGGGAVLLAWAWGTAQYAYVVPLLFAGAALWLLGLLGLLGPLRSGGAPDEATANEATASAARRELVEAASEAR